MNVKIRNNNKFIRSFAKCVSVENLLKTGFETIHLCQIRGRNRHREYSWEGATLCDSGVRHLAPPDDETPFNPTRDLHLPGFCPTCRAAYEAEALEHLGARPGQRIVF